MKNLKYVLFTFVIFFITISNVYGGSMYCEYNANTLLGSPSDKNSNQYIKLIVFYNETGSNSTVQTQIDVNGKLEALDYNKTTGAATTYYIDKKNKEQSWSQISVTNMFSASTMKSYYDESACPAVKMSDLDGTYTSYKAEPVKSTTASSNTAKVTIGTTKKYDDTGKETEVEVVEKTDSCEIEGGNKYIDLKMTFSMYSDGTKKVKICKKNTTHCSEKNNDGKEQTFVINTGSSQYKIQVSANTMNSFFTQTSSQQKNNTFTCKNNSNVYIISTDAWAHQITTDKEEAEQWSGNNFNGGEVTNTEPTTPETPQNNPSKNEQENTLDLEHFCKGPVLGVFTTLGWVIFILKIAVPVILIIFGSIDLAKAVVSSKDDEIKKSIKTLVVRAIAGIIIFFVPTILKFVVSIIDNDNVYNGTFGDCTKCIIDPTPDASDGYTCSGLRGE